MKVKIRLARKSDLLGYSKLLQKTFQDAYTDERLGLKKELFSEEVFSSPRIQKYLASNLKISHKQKTWLVFMDFKMIGSITITEREEDYELRGFYVATKYQGQGIGKKLWKLVKEFANKKDITLDTYTHGKRTIKMYKKWGFKIDKNKGEFYRHWAEWPEGVRGKCVFMRYKMSG